MSARWHDVLDQLSAQMDLQEATLRRGHDHPDDLVITEQPEGPMSLDERLRALALFDRSEALADECVATLISKRPAVRSVYRARQRSGRS